MEGLLLSCRTEKACKVFLRGVTIMTRWPPTQGFPASPPSPRPGLEVQGQRLSLPFHHDGDALVDHVTVEGAHYIHAPLDRAAIDRAQDVARLQAIRLLPADSLDGDVHPQQTAFDVDQRPPRSCRDSQGIGLQHLLDHGAVGMEALARQATDDAEAGRFAQAQRGADRHAEFPKAGQGGFQGDGYRVPLGDKKRVGQPMR